MPEEHDMEIVQAEVEGQDNMLKHSGKVSPNSNGLAIPEMLEGSEGQSDKRSQATFCAREIQADRPRFDVLEAVATVRA